MQRIEIGCDTIFHNASQILIHSLHGRRGKIMGNSLQDQFLKLGLANKKQVNKIKKNKYQQKKAKGIKPEDNESKILAQEAMAQRKKRDTVLNKKRNKKLKQKEAVAQIRQLIEKYRQQYNEGDTPYNFSDNNKIKRIYLPKEICDKLGAGKLAIVRQAGEYQIVPAQIGRKIQTLNKKQVILLHSPTKPDTEDPYAEFQIPDDLVW